MFLRLLAFLTRDHELAAVLQRARTAQLSLAAAQQALKKEVHTWR